jgi:hypothetical protein
MSVLSHELAPLMPILVRQSLRTRAGRGDSCASLPPRVEYVSLKGTAFILSADYQETTG